MEVLVSTCDFKNLHNVHPLDWDLFHTTLYNRIASTRDNVPWPNLSGFYIFADVSGEKTQQF